MKKIFIIVICIFIKQFCFAQSQMEMNQQAFADYKKADAKMTALYKKVQKIIADPKEKSLLLEAQRTWTKFKEAHCRSISAAEQGGTIYPLIYTTCLQQLTEDRIIQLKIYLKTF